MSKNRSKIKWLIIFLLIMTVSIFVDQYTKLLAIKYLQGKEAYSLIENVLELRFFSNTGIAWSMLEGQLFFILFTGIVFLSVMLFFIIKLPDEKKFHSMYILCGVLGGGALGNMIDRIRLGYVVDFIYVSIIDFPIFNVADMFIVVSLIIVAIYVLFVFKEDDFAFLNFKQTKIREMK